MVKTKILLVEDDKSLREIYGVRLYSEGYDIISAGDGEEALAMAIKERPTLIISDVMMPKISGFDMLDILRSTTETKSIKVIMMTALSSEDQRARGEALGADRYLVKSQVGIEDVVRTVHEVLGDAPVSGMTSAVNPATFPSPSPAPMPAPNPVPAAAAAPITPSAPVPSVFNTPSAQPSTPAAPASVLPQPTAPFSTNRPASLGDRVIHPLQSSEPSKDFGAMMSAELSNTPQPNINPVAAAEPEQPVTDLESLIPPIPATSLEQPISDSQTATMPTPSTPPPADVPMPDSIQPQEQVAAPVTNFAIPEPQAAPIAPVMDTLPPQPAAMPEEPMYSDTSVSTLPPDAPIAPDFAMPVAAPDSFAQPQAPAAAMTFEETPYAPNPSIPVAPPVVESMDQPGDSEPSIVVPQRPTPGV